MKRAKSILVWVLFFSFVFSFTGFAADKKIFDTKPRTNNGKKWRIAYYEGGEYIDYQQILSETVKGLMALGWIEPAAIPPLTGEKTTELWHWLAHTAKSRYLQFIADGHYCANWDDSLRPQTVNRLTRRLNRQQDVDLLIAMGTWAGKDFANNHHKTATMVLSASDPLSAGIIKSVEDSGYEHVHASVDPKRFERQIRVFHEIVGFKKLGVAFENSVNGRSYAAMDVIEKVAAELGFELIACHTQSDIADTTQAENSVKQCFRTLSQKVEAIYVTQQGGINRRSIPALVRIANEYKVPTFSQSGSEEVKHGFLVSIAHAGFKYVGQFHALTFAKVFNGARPNQLDQLFEEPPKIALNLKTAEIIGINPSLMLLGATDELFHDIATQ